MLPLEPALPSEPRHYYPHLSKGDAELATPFLRAHGKAYREVRYDVRVGVGQTPPPDASPEMIKDMSDLSRRRIDMVGYTGGRIEIIEFKRLPGLAAIGQLLSYRALYLQTYSPPERIALILVADSIPTDVRSAAEALGIKVLEITPEPI